MTLTKPAILPETTVPEHVRAVRRGAALLDKKTPGWERKINPDILDIASCDRCVLGQLYGRYGDGCLRVLSHDFALVDSSRHGFRQDYDPRFGIVAHTEACNALTDAWREEIRLRRLTQI